MSIESGNPIASASATNGCSSTTPAPFPFEDASMNQSSKASPRWQRLPQIVSFENRASFTETYGFAGNSGKVNLEGQLLRAADRWSNTVYVFMHPTSTLQLLPMPTALADLGLHVLCAASRYAKNDSALIMENVVIDLGRWLRHARETLGYKNVILVGWSGGGSLSLFYQAQAEKTDVTITPAGDPIDLRWRKTAAGGWRDLRRRTLVPRRDAHRMDRSLGHR